MNIFYLKHHTEAIFFYTFNKAKDSGIIKTVCMTLCLLKSKLKTEFNIGAYI